MNLGDGWSMGRHCNSVTVSGAPTAAAAKKKDKGGERRESKLSAEKKRLRKGQRQ